jgi:uncharacterized protein with PIN domain
MRFVADVMLGRLARWLRMMGHDVLYSNRYRDDELARIADTEDRILLTRDRGLLARYRVNRAVLVTSVRLSGQLRELRDGIGLTCGAEAFSRCTRCNAPVEEISREEARGEVPPYVQRNAPAFFRCHGCGKVYWPGSHVRRMKKLLDEIFRRGA